MAVILAVTLAATLGFYSAYRLIRSKERIASTSSIIAQIQPLSEWVTVKYVLEKVVKLEAEPSVLGRDRIILLAHGVVKAGVDLQRLGPDDIRLTGKKAWMRLPPARITDCYLDEKKTEIWEHKTAFWRPTDTQLEQNARRQALDQLRVAAGERGIQKEAMERARAQIIFFLKTQGYEQIEFYEGSEPVPQLENSIPRP